MKKVILMTALFLVFLCGCGATQKVTRNEYFTVEQDAVEFSGGAISWEFPEIANINEETTGIYVVSSNGQRDFLAVVRDDDGEYTDIDFVLVQNDRNDIWAIYDKKERPVYVGRGYILVGDDHRLRCIYKESGDWREANFSKIHENGWVGPTMFSVL